MKEKTGDNGIYMAAFIFKSIYTLQIIVIQYSIDDCS